MFVLSDITISFISYFFNRVESEQVLNYLYVVVQRPSRSQVPPAPPLNLPLLQFGIVIAAAIGDTLIAILKAFYPIIVSVLVHFSSEGLPS